MEAYPGQLFLLQIFFRHILQDKCGDFLGIGQIRFPVSRRLPVQLIGQNPEGKPFHGKAVLLFQFLLHKGVSILLQQEPVAHGPADGIPLPFDHILIFPVLIHKAADGLGNVGVDILIRQLQPIAVPSLLQSRKHISDGIIIAEA